MSPEQIGLVAVLIAIGVAGVARKWVFGWVYEEMKADRDFWRQRALTMTGVAEIATDDAEERAP